jgi:hypothetical protein
MATQEIEYAAGNDTGEREVAAIAPILPGEKVKAAIMDRPMESLRNRSEVIRDELIDQKYLQDTDIRWVIADGAANTGLNPGGELPAVLWNLATKTFTLPVGGSALILQPIKTPVADTVEVATFTFPEGMMPDNTIDVTSTLRNYRGMNRRLITWEMIDPGLTGIDKAIATLSGAPAHHVHIQVNDDDTTQVSDVSAVLAAIAGSLMTAGFSVATTGSGNAFITAGVLPADYEYTQVHEREMHRIPDSEFVAFFADPTHVLTDGDTLAVWYEYMTEPGTDGGGNIGGRRQSCTTNSNITLDAGQLFLTSLNPELIPIAIPICKRIGDDLLFIDGTICYGHMTDPTLPIAIGEHGYTVERIYSAASSVLVNIVNLWADGLAPTGAAGTINQAFNGIVGDLAGIAAGTCGSKNIGTEVVAGTPDSLATTSVGLQLAELLARTNERIETIHPTATSAAWVLLWRSNAIANDGLVTKDTTSLYWMNGQFSIVVGGYWSDATHIVAGLAGTFTDVVVSMWTAAGGLLTASKAAPAPGAVMHITVPADWTTMDVLSSNIASNAMVGTQKTFKNTIKYGVDQTCLREAFSDNEWHLVYRNNGQTTVNADVDWYTFSVYEQVNVAGTAVAKMEIYGAYLDTATGEIISPAAGGPGRVSFTKMSNDTADIMATGHCYNVADATTLDPTDVMDWDYLELYEETAPTVFHTSVYGAFMGRTVYQDWNIISRFYNPLRMMDLVSSYISGVPSAEFPTTPGLLFNSDVAGKTSIYYGESAADPCIWITANTHWFSGAPGVWHEDTNPGLNCAAALKIGSAAITQFMHLPAGAASWAYDEWDAFQSFTYNGNSQEIFADNIPHETAAPLNTVILPIHAHHIGIIMFAIDSSPGGAITNHDVAVVVISPAPSIDILVGTGILGTSTGSKAYNFFVSGANYVFENHNGGNSVDITVSAYLAADLPD